MNKVTLFVTVGIEEEVKSSDVSFTVHEFDMIESDGVQVARNGHDKDMESKIVARETFVLGRKREYINFKDHDLILEMEVALKEGVNPDDIQFAVESAEVDGFEILVLEKPEEFEDESIVDANNTYIVNRYEKLIDIA